MPRTHQQTNPEGTQQFSITLILVVLVAGVLAFSTLAIMYGCAKANGAASANTPTTGMILLSGGVRTL